MFIAQHEAQCQNYQSSCNRVFGISVFLTASSVLALRNNQNENIRLFKEEFLNLGRESFDNTSMLFFDNLDNKIETTTSASQNIIDIVQQVDPEKKNTLVYSLPEENIFCNRKTRKSRNF